MNNTIRNFFRDGLIMDLAPDNTQNSQLTNALNATFVTFNGNELSLQNDMGNARVETAMLPEGYIPIGSAELGGIIYIAAFNPFTKKCQLGSFPSPERNLEKEEISPNGLNAMLSADNFQELDGTEPTGELKTTLHKIDLGMPILHPGDKFYVCADTITALVNNGSIWNGTTGYVDIYLATINSENKIVKLELSKKSSGHVIGTAPIKNGGNNYDINSYRKTMESNYDVYTAKESGKLYIVAELVTIDDFEASIKVNKADVYLKVGSFSKYVGIKPKELVITCLLKSGTAKPEEIPKPITKRIDYKETAILLNNYDFTFQEDAIYEFTITPVMDYGYLSNLMVNLTVFCNSKIETDISEWRYYNADEYINLKFTINSTIQSNELELNFYEYDNTAFSNTPNFTIKYNNLFSVSKNYTETIYLDKEYDTDYFQGILNKNKFYRVSIKLGTEELKEGEEKTTYYLYVYTCPIFNGFYESQDYYIDTTYCGSPLYNFNLIDHTYGYKENDESIYPLKLTPYILENLEFRTHDKFEENVNVANLIANSIPNNAEVSYTYKVIQSEKLTINVGLQEGWGIFQVNSFTKTISSQEDPKIELFTYENDILNIKKQITNTAKLDYNQQLLNVYNFKPLVYDEKSANQYGLTVLKANNTYTVKSIMTKFPMWFFFSEKGESNKDFQTGIIQLDWSDATGTMLERVNDNNAQHKYLNMYDDDTVQSLLKDVLKPCSKSTIIPHLFAFWETSNTNGEFKVVADSNTVNSEYVLVKNSIIYYNELGSYSNTDTYSTSDSEVQFCNNVTRIAGGYEVPRIWSFVMLDENGDYKPINCFMVQVDRADQSGSSDNCVAIGETTSESMVKQIFDMLSSIYKVDNISNESKYVGYAKDTSINNTTTITIKTSDIELNISRNENINNLNYFLEYSSLEEEKPIVTKQFVYVMEECSKDDILTYINVPNQLCFLYNTQIQVNNLNLDSIYYKLQNADNGAVLGLTLMDKNFVWRNSTTITANPDGIFSLNYSSGTLTVSSVNYTSITGTLTKGSTSLKKNCLSKNNTSTNITYSINKIKVLLESGNTIDSYVGGFGGIAKLTLSATNIDKSNIIKYINIDLGSISPRIATIQPNAKVIEETIILDSPVNFNSNCSITLDGVTIYDTQTTVNVKIYLYGTKTTKPTNEIINSGIGEYLTLKDGKLVLKGNLFGNDRHVHINAGGANYITNWKFNSQIQFKNEFAI